MPFAVPRALPLTLLAAFVLAGCAEKGAAPLKEGEKPVDVASVVRQKMPASVKDRSEWADALATTFKSQKIAPTEENICSVLAVAQQESMYQSDPVVPGLNKIAWKRSTAGPNRCISLFSWYIPPLKSPRQTVKAIANGWIR